ncbi:MAG TPA: 2-keto-4-pentenoate hydratase [Casimicrobiaceae bacterium]|jgi:2-keto-4-pentenoate hydratase
MMDARDIEGAARLFVAARRTGDLLDRLPESCRPRTLDDAHAIQDATVRLLREDVAGWKVGAPMDGQIVRGALLRSRVIESGAMLAPKLAPMLGIEAEIAFRFDRDLPPRATSYTYAEVAAAVTAFAAIEIVDSRFRDYPNPPLLDRIADCVSNGAFVKGTPQPRWRDFDLSTLEVALVIGGKEIVRRVGGHPATDPLLPAVALVNDCARRDGVQAGKVMTTGTYTGLNHAKPGETVVAIFEDFGRADVTIDDAAASN